MLFQGIKYKSHENRWGIKKGNNTSNSVLITKKHSKCSEELPDIETKPCICQTGIQLYFKKLT